MNRKEYQREWKKLNPWLESFYKLRQRCNNPKNQDYIRYGKRGIQALIIKEEVKKLWFRDKAYEMKYPTIDRINNNGNYIFGNCRFIENKLNAKKDKTNKKVFQYDKYNNLIKIWDSQRTVAKFLNFDQGWISRCINKNKIGYGYYWRNHYA